MKDKVESEAQVVTTTKILQMQRRLFVLLNQGRHEEFEKLRSKLDKMSETDKKSSNPRLILRPMQDSIVSNVVSKTTVVEQSEDQLALGRTSAHTTVVEQSASMVTDETSKEITGEAAEEMGHFDDLEEHPLLHSSADKDQLEWIGSSTG